ncbi:GIY-YIG nuclease family protein [Candidatus Gottesmanbacteria bacterium]|nr:GIY-YIG nuclease family protein [Candidatus Gottesmanbacteria bacterium]
MKRWFVYIARCTDDSLYTGITTNYKRRIWQHNTKLGAKSLKGKLPVELIYKETYNNQFDAARREQEIKGWSRSKKLKLIKGLP